MPKKSVKSDLIEALTIRALLNDDDSEDEFDDPLDSLIMAHAFRYGAQFQRGAVAKSSEWRNSVLADLDDDRFKQLIRMSRTEFDFILNEIKGDPVFSSSQHPVELQLMVVLYRLGCSGEGATVAKIANLFGIGDGGTISNMTHRIFRAILNQEGKYVSWPDEEERAQLVKLSMEELPFCIGYVDGTEIPLAERPSVDPDSYYSRKQRFSIKAQIVCDRKLVVKHLLVGYPGSVHDARIYSNCVLSKDPAKFFSGQEWLAGDSAYRLTSTVVTPFKKEGTPIEKKFNRKFSTYRVRVEHCIGILKERFGSLKELRVRLHNTKSAIFACHWVAACVTLHNMLRKQSEEFEADDVAGYEDAPGEELPPEDIGVVRQLHIEGIIKRQSLLNLLQL